MHKHQEIRAIFKKAFLHPRYWLTWIGVGCLYVLVQLPYPLIYQLGKISGLISMRYLHRRREIARQNIQLCFPHLSAKEQASLLRDNFISTGLGIFEAGMAWFWSDKRIQKHSSFVGDEYISKAQEAGKGVLLIGIHFLTLELGARILGIKNAGIGVYRPNNHPVMDYVQLRGRLKANKYMLNRYDTRGMVRALKKGELLWYAPDHDYGRHNSVFVPLFAVDKAATTIGTRVLVKLSKCEVISFTPKREKNGHYTIYVNKPVDNFPIDDDLYAAKLMNSEIEKAILKAPEQYMWLHRRFKTRPPGEKSLYTDGL